jgi:hypothetical protein
MHAAESVMLGPASADAALSAVRGTPCASANSHLRLAAIALRSRRIVRPAVPLWTAMKEASPVARSAC